MLLKVGKMEKLLARVLHLHHQLGFEDSGKKLEIFLRVRKKVFGRAYYVSNL